MRAQDSNRQTEAKVEYIIGGNMVLVASVIVYWPDQRDVREQGATYEIEIYAVHEKATGLEFEIDDILIARRSAFKDRAPTFSTLESEIDFAVAEAISKGEIE